MKENLKINLKNAGSFVSQEEIMALAQLSTRHLESLNNGTGQGNDFLGWLSLPDDILPQLNSIEKIASHLRSVSDATVVIGIGGSYLGARAVIESMSHTFPSLLKKNPHEIFYAGHNISEDYLSELLEILDNRNYSIIVISKSGTTTEPAIAFRILKNHLERKVGKAVAADKIIAITDSSKGALRSLAEMNGYETFTIPDNVGGRYSVLTPVGLLPVAVAGLDIRSLIKGAQAMESITRFNKDATTNPALQYASARNLILQTNRLVEILVSFNPKLHFFAEWWKQLYGESEGKNENGIFPAAVDFTTDLHSMGQYIQEGKRMLFETIISVKNSKHTLVIPLEKEDADELNYIAGKKLTEVNQSAEIGTIMAHNDGNVPVITVSIPDLDEFYVGQLIYFFEISCALSGYILDVNPFDQPGVEAYKKNMFALLNKPGFEEQAAKLKGRM